jgi:hypothetical protein
LCQIHPQGGQPYRYLVSPPISDGTETTVITCPRPGYPEWESVQQVSNCIPSSCCHQILCFPESLTLRFSFSKAMTSFSQKMIPDGTLLTELTCLETVLACTVRLPLGGGSGRILLLLENHVPHASRINFELVVLQGRSSRLFFTSRRL